MPQSGAPILSEPMTDGIGPANRHMVDHRPKLATIYLAGTSAIGVYAGYTAHEQIARLAMALR